jgi:hypothetical protein
MSVVEEYQHDPLESALAKVRSANDMAHVELSLGERGLLRSYAAARLSEEGLLPAEYAFCVRLQNALHERLQQPAVAESTVEESRQRTNWTLRNAIEKTRTGRPQELVEFEIRLMENTLAGLRALSEPSDNHTRLQSILEQSLDTYYNYYEERASAATPPAGVPAAPASAVAPPSNDAFLAPDAQECSQLLRGGPRSQIQEIGGVVIGRPMQVYEHRGDLHLTGEINEDVLVVVRDGGLRIEGAVSGVVQADGPIHLRGNLTGGTLISNLGAVSVAKALYGSRIVAPKGGIQLDSAEHPALLYTSVELNVAGDLSGAATFCRNAAVGGALRGGTLAVLDGAEVGQLAPGRKEAARVEFRALLSPLEFGGELPQGVESHLQEYTRAVIEAEFAHCLQQEIGADFRDLLNLVIARLSTGSFSDQKLLEMRGLQIGRCFGGLVCETGFQLARSMEQCILLRDTGPKAVLLPSIEACQKSLRTLEKDLAAQPPALSGLSKTLIEGQAGQLQLTMKRSLDAAMGGQDLMTPLGALCQRLRDWQSAKREAELGLDALSGALKEQGFAVDAVAAGVEEFAGRVLGRLAKGGMASGALAAQLKKLIQYYIERMDSTGAGAQAKRQRANTIAVELERDWGVLLAGHRAPQCVVQPQGIANGTVATALPGAREDTPGHAALLMTIRQYEQRPARISSGLSGIQVREL